MRKIKDTFTGHKGLRKAEARPKVLINCEKVPEVVDLSKSITASPRR